MRKPYATRRKASEAWLRRAKWQGIARVLGGGWWQIGSSKPIQGHDALGGWLERRGMIARVDDGFELREAR